MKKTRSEFNKVVNQYIMDCIDSDGYELKVQPQTDKEKLQFLYNTFWSEKLQYNREYYKSEHAAFMDWIQGLPSSFNVDYEYYRIIELAMLWGSLPHDATEKQTDKICENWFNFIASKTFQLFRKNKIQPQVKEVA